MLYTLYSILYFVYSNIIFLSYLVIHLYYYIQYGYANLLSIYFSSCRIAGTSWSVHPICGMHYRSGGLSEFRYAIIPTVEGAIVFSYDLTTETLCLRAKVQVVSHADATAGHVVSKRPLERAQP
jgi:hypothetical protein